MSERLRILVLSQHYWPEAFRINSFVEELRAVGADVTVLTGQPNYPAGRVYPGYRWWGTGRFEHPSGYEVYRVPLFPRGSGGAVRLVLNYLSFIVGVSLCGSWHMRGRRFDAIFVYATSPVLQALGGLPIRWLTGGQLVLWVQDLWPDVLRATGFVRNRRVLGAVATVVGWLYRRTNLILAQSPSFAAAIAPMAGSVPVAYFPNPGERPVLSQRARASLSSARFNIVYAGNLGRAQAVDSILEAAALLRTRDDLHITLYGDGAMLDWMQKQVAERDLQNVTLAGRVPPETMPHIFAQASALLLTLVDDDMVARTIPSKLQSYLSAGVPLIVAASGEAARIADEAGAGIVCKPSDAQALANALSGLASLPTNRRAAMGAAGKAYYDQHFEPVTLANKLVAMLDALRSRA